MEDPLSQKNYQNLPPLKPISLLLVMWLKWTPPQSLFKNSALSSQLSWVHTTSSKSLSTPSKASISLIPPPSELFWSPPPHPQSWSCPHEQGTSALPSQPHPQPLSSTYDVRLFPSLVLLSWNSAWSLVRTLFSSQILIVILVPGFFWYLKM